MKASLSIAAEFRSRIARGDLRAGEPLPVESELMDELGVSKGVVREALRILETEGLVEVRRGLGGGPRVRHPSISQAAQAIGVYLQIGDVLVTDVWETRDRIIAGAVERLAQQRGGPNLGLFEASVARLSALVGDLLAYYPQLLDAGEKAVLAAGSATEHVIVVSLRQIIAAELDAATKAVDDVGQAVAAEVNITQVWDQTLAHIRAGRHRAARRRVSGSSGHRADRAVGADERRHRRRHHQHPEALTLEGFRRPRSMGHTTENGRRPRLRGFSVVCCALLYRGARQRMGAGLVCRLSLSYGRTASRRWGAWHGPRVRSRRRGAGSLLDEIAPAQGMRRGRERARCQVGSGQGRAGRARDRAYESVRSSRTPAGVRPPLLTTAT